MKQSLRKEIRLPFYDYSSSGWYFVTICTNYRRSVFYPHISAKYGHDFKNLGTSPKDSQARKNTELLKEVICELESKYYVNLEIDFYCIMPDHVHLIIVFNDLVKRRGELESRNYSLRDVVGALKAIISRYLGFQVWQPNYYEHIIRTEGSLDRIRNYILQNPEKITIDWVKLDPKV